MLWGSARGALLVLALCVQLHLAVRVLEEPDASSSSTGSRSSSRSSMKISSASTKSGGPPSSEEYICCCLKAQDVDGPMHEVDYGSQGQAYTDGRYVGTAQKFASSEAYSYGVRKFQVSREDWVRPLDPFRVLLRVLVWIQTFNATINNKFSDGSGSYSLTLSKKALKQLAAGDTRAYVALHTDYGTKVWRGVNQGPVSKMTNAFINNIEGGDPFLKPSDYPQGYCTAHLAAVVCHMRQGGCLRGEQPRSGYCDCLGDSPEGFKPVGPQGGGDDDFYDWIHTEQSYFPLGRVGIWPGKVEDI